MPSHQPNKNRPSSGATKFALTDASRPIVVAAFSAMPGNESSLPSTSRALPTNRGIKHASRLAAWGVNGPEFSPHRTHTSPTAQTALLHIAGCIGSIDEIASDNSLGSPASINVGARRAKSPNRANALIRTPGIKCSATFCNTFGNVGPNLALPFTNATKFPPNPSHNPSIKSTAQIMGSVMSSSISAKSSSCAMMIVQASMVDIAISNVSIAHGWKFNPQTTVLLPKHSINESNDRSNGFSVAISFHNRNKGGMYIPGKGPSPIGAPMYSAMTPRVSYNTSRLRVPYFCKA
mmetsp:Transcript_33807/g.57414  ORF Transcript_33807/g.57414 Transcript_33807/m.57414 type:complete len:292 (-) Transcript_33807:119-994(-)